MRDFFIIISVYNGHGERLLYSSFYSLLLANWGIDNLKSYQMNEWTAGRANEYNSLSNKQVVTKLSGMCVYH